MTRVKTVFPTEAIAHRWAHQLEDYARNAYRNFYYEGKTIYSYGRHFPIASLAVNPNASNEATVFLTYRTYSNTTAGHIATVRGAITHMNVIRCHNPKNAIDGYHTDNLNDYASQINYHLKQITPRTRNHARYIVPAQDMAADASAYMAFFKIKPTPELKKAIATAVSTEVIELMRQSYEDELARKEKARAKQMRLLEKALPYWRNATPSDQIPDELKGLHIPDDITLLRVVGDTVETSKGIKLSTAVAKRFYQWYMRIAPKGCKGCDYKMLDYPVTEANAERLVVGCHNIARSEIDYIAKQLNF